MTRTCPSRATAAIVVTRYELDLTYRMSSNRLSGKANLSAVSLQPLTRFSLDLVGLQVTKVSVNGRRAKQFSTRDGKLFIWPDKELPVRSAMSVEIRYAGNPGPRFGPVGRRRLGGADRRGAGGRPAQRGRRPGSRATTTRATRPATGSRSAPIRLTPSYRTGS